MEGNESIQCTICGNFMKSQRAVCYKVSACCGVLRTMHIPCAKAYHLKLFPSPATPLYPDPKNPFSKETWSSQPSTKMLCIKCRADCLFCKKGHHLSNDLISFIQCTTPNCHSWSYYIKASSQTKNLGCIDKSSKKLDTVICGKCD